jgi:hypothetical protein
MSNEFSYLPRCGAIKAIQVGSDLDAFVLSFNSGKYGPPFAVYTGEKRLTFVLEDGRTTRASVGNWIVDPDSGTYLRVVRHDDFREDFIPIESSVLEEMDEAKKERFNRELESMRAGA